MKIIISGPDLPLNFTSNSKPGVTLIYALHSLNVLKRIPLSFCKKYKQGKFLAGMPVENAFDGKKEG